ncbi:hypothetical protein ACHAXA_003069 [Cyclostephanos tholiformis]|uniref:Uncharacterized protein n=1 Tax=Cyclostephanos tholiformis TaxID=382380 RepID=A0ABD3R4T6_9STRA
MTSYITQESLISPSKMKQRSRKKTANSSLQSPVNSPSRIKLRSPQESRDDSEVSLIPSSSTPQKSKIVKSPTSRRQTTPRVNNSSKFSVSDAFKDTNTDAMMEAPPLKTDEESPRSKLQKKLLSNLRPPDPSLAELLDVLTDFEQTSLLRRVNACGAIKTLTMHKANQIPLARTNGVVPSITSVLCAVNATEEERTRCINALMHLCVPEENWKLVYMFPQTSEALARNMADKYPQIRYAACLATSFLAKKNRKDLVVNRLLMYAMARVLEVDKNGALEAMGAQDKKVFIGARACVLKMILHLSKNKDVSTALARTECVMSSLVSIAGTMELAANILCIAIMTNLTRHPDNAPYLLHKVPNLVATLVHQIESADIECRKCALYGLQNLSCASNCRQDLANTPDLLGNVTKAAFQHDHPEQQISALHTLKNLSDDPFNLVTMTNTPGCTATLLALANNDSAGGDGNKKDVSTRRVMAQYLACDTLATLSHWLLTLSTTRKSKDSGGSEGGGGKGGIDAGRRTFKQHTWDAWN